MTVEQYRLESLGAESFIPMVYKIESMREVYGVGNVTNR